MPVWDAVVHSSIPTRRHTLTVVHLDVRSTVHLDKLVLDDMTRRGVGKVLVTSSVASTMPGPYQAVYNASKSFVESFSEALHSELTGTGASPSPR